MRLSVVFKLTMLVLLARKLEQIVADTAYLAVGNLDGGMDNAQLDANAGRILGVLVLHDARLLDAIDALLAFQRDG